MGALGPLMRSWRSRVARSVCGGGCNR